MLNKRQNLTKSYNEQNLYVVILSFIGGLMSFGLVYEIVPDDLRTLQKLFVTFDIDWASDEVLEYCIDIVEKANIKATWFVTHETPLLKRLRSNPNFELGIHPNFNPLLEGDFVYGKNYKEVLKYYLNIVPEAKSMRSHCLGVSSRILQDAKNLGITHDSNLCIPMMATNPDKKGFLGPYIDWDSLIRCPYFWEDGMSCIYERKINFKDFLYQSNFYFMVAFHPIHVFLNTESLNRYESARKYFHNYSELKRFRNNSTYGSCDILKDVLACV